MPDPRLENDAASRDPLIVLAIDDRQVREAMAAKLSARDRAFEVLAVGGSEAAARALDGAAADERPVALVVIDAALGEERARSVLDAADRVAPGAKRAILDPAGAAADPAPGYDCRLAAGVDAAMPLAELDDLLDEWSRVDRQSRGDLVLIGFAWSQRCHELRDLLLRNRIGFRWIDLDADPRAAARLLLGTDAARGPFPVVVVPGGPLLRDPATAELAAALGAATTADQRLYDLVIVGGGPAGLAAAVSAASEGLATVIVEATATGGQAGASARIENYPGFPRGIRGANLADRMFVQARRFGADLVLANPASELQTDGSLLRVCLEEGEASGLAVLLACGVRYERLGVPGEDRLAGRGVYYTGALAEAPELAEQRVVVVGGANSAGQAAVHLASHACNVVLAVRGETLEARMSEYLAAQVRALENVEVRTGTSVRRLFGRRRLERVELEGPDGPATLDAAACYVFVGRQPRTGWLPAAIARDDDGYVLVGVDADEALGQFARGTRRRRAAFETTMDGVFAAGDVRRGAVGRVAQAVGDGAAVMPAIHEHLRRFHAT